MDPISFILGAAFAGVFVILFVMLRTIRGTTTIYHAKDGWRWRAQSKNNRIVSESGEAYEEKGTAIHAAHQFGPRRFEVKVA